MKFQTHIIISSTWEALNREEAQAMTRKLRGNIAKNLQSMPNTVRKILDADIAVIPIEPEMSV
jgi:hypothetical protein